MCRTRRILITALLLLTLAGCGYDTLYSDLGERQANDMLALLLREGFDARKVRADTSWALEIKRAHLPSAVEILNTHGYPRDGYESLGEIFRKEGFVSSPLEERARLVHGLSQELSRTIASIDGVVVSRVHLALPERNPLREERPPASASIFIKHRPGESMTRHTAPIKALVVNSVEGLPYDNVTVTFFEADPVPERTVPPAAALFDASSLQPAQIGAGAATLAGLPVLVYFLRRRRGAHS